MTNHAPIQPRVDGVVAGVGGIDVTALPLFSQALPTQSPPRQSLPGWSTRLVGDAAGGEAPSASDVRVDWSLVASLRSQASEQLSQAVAAQRGRLDKAAQEDLAADAPTGPRMADAHRHVSRPHSFSATASPNISSFLYIPIDRVTVR